MTLLLYAQKCDQYDQYNKIAPSALADFIYLEWNSTQINFNHLVFRIKWQNNMLFYLNTFGYIILIISVYVPTNKLYHNIIIII